MGRVSLVLGGNGFLGHYVTRELVRNKIHTCCLVRRNPLEFEKIPGVEYYVGNAMDRDFLIECLTDVDTVYYCISTSMPNGGKQNLQEEIDYTLKALDCLLSAMNEAGVRNIAYPSSGGAIYGNQNGIESVDEQSVLEPTTPYGIGKLMSEEMLKYYNRRYSINSYVFRIGNVYGSEFFRDKSQGVVDVFIQAALKGMPITLWGDAAKSVRDYIYLEDAAKAMVDTVLVGQRGYHVFNVGTGIGTSVLEIIGSIEKVIDRPIKVYHNPQKVSGVTSIVLNCDKIKNFSGWSPKVSLEEGIRLTIEAKRGIQTCDRKGVENSE